MANAACYRHGKKCLKPPPVQELKSYFSRDGVYVCGQCDKTCSHQSNIICHSRICKGIKKVYKCKKCSKTFSYKFHLETRLKNHLKKCDLCNQRFRKVDLLNEHCLKCVGVNNDDEQFEPSFTFFPNYQSADVIDEFTLMSIQPNDQFVFK